MRRWGRLGEVDLAAFFNLRSGHLLANIDLVPSLLRKGKFHLIPKREAASDVRAVMAKVDAGETAERKKPAPQGSRV